MLRYFSREKTLFHLLIAGCVLRIMVFLVMNASNPDQHHEVLRFIKEFHRLPRIRELFLATHPPFYYLVALPFYWFDDPVSLKLTQLLSLLIGTFNLYLIYKLHQKLVADVLVRNLAFLIAAFNPTFLAYSLYVSNDTMAFLMGTGILYLIYLYVNNPTSQTEIFLAIVTGLALLTKTTFLPFIPLVVLVVLLMRWKSSPAKADVVISLVAFVSIVFFLGSYKFIENKHYEHKFFLHNLDFFPLNHQATYKGIENFINFNLWDLITFPGEFNDDHATRYAYFLTFYATFWYKHIDFENNLNLGNYTSFKYIGSLIYIFGLLPTLTFFGGFFIKIKDSILTVWDILWGKGFSSTGLYKVFLTAVFTLSFLAVFGAGIKYDGWSFFHGRFLGHVMVALLFIMAVGFSYLKKLSTPLFNISAYSLIIASSLHVVYFVVESVWEVIGG